MNEAPQLHPLSCSEDMGCLFQDNSGRLLRGLSPKQYALLSELSEKLSFQRAIKRRQIVPFKNLLEGFDRFSHVVEVERISPVIYPFEWCDEMVKDASLFTLELSLSLLEDEIVIHDPHQWNLLFEGCSPIFVDLGAFTFFSQVEELYLLEEGMRRSHVDRLKFIKASRGKLARALMLYSRVISASDIPREFSLSYSIANQLGPLKIPLRFLKKLFNKQKSVSAKKRSTLNQHRSFLNSLHQQISNIKLPGHNSVWSKYDPLKDNPLCSNKVDIISRLLGEFPSTQVLDIGCNRGRYSLIAAAKGHKVLALDSDSRSISQLYIHCRKHAPTVSTILMDILKPSPPIGYLGLYGEDALRRFKSPIVLFLAIIHHLSIKKNIHFKHLASMLAQICSSRLIVEFVYPGDATFVNNNWSVPEWYTLEQFEEAFAKKFRIESREAVSSTREIFVLKLLNCS